VPGSEIHSLNGDNKSDLFFHTATTSDNSPIDLHTPDQEKQERGVALRDSEVLSVIEEEDLTRFTFEGMKRRMGAHPETLSRTLERLEDQNILERRPGGYQLTEKGRAMVNVHPLSNSANRISLVRTLLPPSLPIEAVIRALEGRWFGELRWLGRTDTPSEVVLKWITSDGRIQLDAMLSEGELRIDGRFLRGEDIGGAIRSSHELMAHISKEYIRPYRGRALMYRNVAPTSFMPN
jgi:DNA-binding MarR family transcriptional regulator